MGKMGQSGNGNGNGNIGMGMGGNGNSKLIPNHLCYILCVDTKLF